MKWAETCFELIQAIRREPFCLPELLGAFTIALKVFTVQHTSFTVSEKKSSLQWAGKLRGLSSATFHI